MSIWTQALGLVTAPLTKVIGKYIDRKTNQDNIKGKAQMAKQSDATQITLTDAEWETVAKQTEGGTWKDEFVTIVIMSPICMLITGAMYQAVTGDPMVMDGALAGIDALKELNLEYDKLAEIVVFAGVGLSIWRKA